MVWEDRAWAVPLTAQHRMEQQPFQSWRDRRDKTGKVSGPYGVRLGVGGGAKADRK